MIRIAKAWRGGEVPEAVTRHINLGVTPSRESAVFTPVDGDHPNLGGIQQCQSVDDVRWHKPGMWIGSS